MSSHGWGLGVGLGVRAGGQFCCFHLLLFFFCFVLFCFCSS